MSSDLNTSSYILTADVGGSHITAAVMDIAERRILKESISRMEVNSNGTAGEILGAWEFALTESIKKGGVGIAGLAMALPGPFDYESGISKIKGLCKYDSIYGEDIKGYLAKSLGLPVYRIKMRNDAEAAIAGEAAAGAGAGYKTAIGVTLGTGLGSALHQQHHTVDLDLGSVSFKDTIADDYFSTRWFIKRYREVTGIQVPNVKVLAQQANEEPLIQEIFQEFGLSMGQFLEQPVAQYQPDILILCGNIAKAAPLFMPALQAVLKTVDIRCATLGEEAALIGAGNLFNSSSNGGKVVSLTTTNLYES